MSATRERILNTALALFNESGVEYVGMRELAAALKMRIGNVTYYFPTKDELVFSLSQEYSETNSLIFAGHPVLGLYDFLKLQDTIFDNQLRYRCLLLSMVHLMEKNQLLSAAYEVVKNQRHSRLEQVMQTLMDAKMLKGDDGDAQSTLISLNSLVGRFWMSEAAVNGKRNQLERQKAVYLQLLASIFRPYATAKGLREIDRFLAEISPN